MKLLQNKPKVPFGFAGIILGITFSLISCSTSEQYSDDIIGKWELLQTDDYELEPGFIWEFKEDLSFSIVNNAGKFETDPFETTPFRGKGTYEGFYLVDAPKGMTMREKYRSPMFFSALEISEDGSTMEMRFDPIEPKDSSDATKDVLAKFKRLN